MKTEQTEFAAFIGIDWADRKHDVCLQDAATGKRERFVNEHRPKVLHAWVEHLRERFGGAPVAVCLELAKGPIISALLERNTRLTGLSMRLEVERIPDWIRVALRCEYLAFDARQ